MGWSVNDIMSGSDCPKNFYLMLIIVKYMVSSVVYQHTNTNISGNNET